MERKLDRRTPFRYVTDTQRLIDEGPIIPASLFLRYNRASETIPINFLIDTGSTITWVRKGTLARLGTKPVSQATVSGVGTAEAIGFMAMIRFGHLENYHEVFEPAEDSVDQEMFENHPFDGLLGRNILRFFDVKISPRKGEVSLLFRSWNLN